MSKHSKLHQSISWDLFEVPVKDVLGQEFGCIIMQATRVEQDNQGNVHSREVLRVGLRKSTSEGATQAAYLERVKELAELVNKQWGTEIDASLVGKEAP